MSRSHLYRSTGRPRPMATVVVLSAWIGAAALYLAVRGPSLLADAPLAAMGPAAASLLAFVLGGGVAAGAVVIVAELIGGRTPRRGARIALAALMLACCMGGQLAAAGPSNALRRGWIAAADAATAPQRAAEVASLHRQGALWLVGGVLVAVLALGVTVESIRRWDVRV